MKDIIKIVRNIFPRRGELSRAVSSLSKKELYVFLSLFGVLAISTIILIAQLNAHFIEKVPMRGGSFTEGIIGIPRFINPVLAVSDADRDMSALVYSGLMSKSPSGELVPDLAESYTVSKDGLTYTFVLKPNILFHDKKPVTADDVVYTINEIKDPAIKSPRRVTWEGVSAEVIDDTTVAFHLKAPFAPFLENTTIGILPAHIWKNITADEFSFSDFNNNAIGSGPYMIDSIEKNSSGVPQSYTLVPWKRATPTAFISTITIRFYSNENELVTALQKGEVDNASGISPENASRIAEKGYRIETTPLSRMFGVFFNKNEAPIFLDTAVVNALSMVVNKQEIIDTVLRGYGSEITSPVPTYLSGKQDQARQTFDVNSIDTAKALLAKDGWTEGDDGILVKKSKKETARLAFSLSTGDTPELKEAAELIKKDFESIGAEVDLKIFDSGSLNQSVIRPRKYDALFFGQVISHESDLYAFWHSSQRNDPGLNIAMYANAKADKLLEATLSTQDRETRIGQYAAFENELAKDQPALFIYSPDFIYAVAKNIQGISLGRVSLPSERFDGIIDWYTETENIWKIFTR